jgi:hypothetical protein
VRENIIEACKRGAAIEAGNFQVEMENDPVY